MKPHRSLLLLGLVVGCAAHNAKHAEAPTSLSAAPSSLPDSALRVPSASPHAAIAHSRHGLDQGHGESAQLSLFGVRAADECPLDFDELLAELGHAEAVCIGEHHPNPHDHDAQLLIFTELLERARANGRELAIGFEMLSTAKQRVLNTYAAGKLTLKQLRHDTDWDQDWGYSFSLYRPLFSTARHRGAALLALNAPRDLVSAVARNGIENLEKSQRRRLPDIDFDNERHRAEFDEAIAGHPDTGTDQDTLYEAQLVWDETMAQTAAAWLEVRRPLRQLVIVAGAEHCKNSAVPERIRRRLDGATIVSALPVLQSAQSGPPALDSGFDYALVLSSDPAVAPLPAED